MLRSDGCGAQRTRHVELQLVLLRTNEMQLCNSQWFSPLKLQGYSLLLLTCGFLEYPSPFVQPAIASRESNEKRLSPFI